LGISDKKNNSAEDGIDGTNGNFWEQKALGIRSEPFRGREKNSEFRSVEQKKKQTLEIPFRTFQRKRKQLEFHSVEQE
jgi:hypothetical protein